MKTIFVILNVFLIFILMGCSSQVPNVKYNDFDSFDNYIDYIIQKEIKDNNLVNISYVLVGKDGLISSKNYGYSDIENNLKTNINSIYRIGSITKVFTSLAIMQLHEKGYLNIDNCIKDYIEDFHYKTRYDDEIITVRNLINHNSGFISDIIQNWYSNEPFERTIDYLKNEYTTSPPEYKFSYSNPGYNLLGIIIQNVSGLSYYDYLKENIFEPLNMKNTSINLLNEKLYSNAFDKNKNQIQEPNLRDVPAGSIYSTPADMINFIQMILNKGTFNDNVIISEKTYKEIRTIQNENVILDLDLNFGLGWFLDETITGGNVLFHGGNTAYYHSILKIDLDNQIGVFITSSSELSSSSIVPISHEILKKYIEYKGNDLFITNRNDDYYYVDVSYNERIQINGYYAGEAGLIKVDSSKKTIKIELMDNKLELMKRNDGLFQARYKILFFPFTLDNVVFGFKEINNQIVIYQKLDNNKKILLGIKFEKQETIPEKFERFLGVYYPNFNDKTLIIEYFEIIEKYGLFLVKTQFQGNNLQFPLKFINEKEAIILGAGRYLGGTITFDETNNEKKIRLFASEFIKK